MSRSGIVTLTTDFGLRDPYVAALEAALVQAWSDVRVIHVSHEVPPGDVGFGAYLLEYAARTFPAGTVHLGVVDPGVGSDRPIYAVETDSVVVVGPGNGLLDRVLRGQALGISVLIPADAGLPGQTFQARDLMAPAAARIASGDSLSAVGRAVEIETQAVAPTLASGPARPVDVAYVDRFGTLVLDLVHPGDWPSGKTALLLGRQRARLGRTYADVDPGNLVAYRGSIGYVEVAIRDGSAAATLGLGAGDTVEIGLD